MSVYYDIYILACAHVCAHSKIDKDAENLKDSQVPRAKGTCQLENPMQLSGWAGNSWPCGDVSHSRSLVRESPSRYGQDPKSTITDGYFRHD